MIEALEDNLNGQSIDASNPNDQAVTEQEHYDEAITEVSSQGYQ